MEIADEPSKDPQENIGFVFEYNTHPKV